MDYWISNVQVRLAFLFGLTGYVYLFKEGGVFGAQSLHETSIGDSLQNSLVFTFGFMEIAVWFWVGSSQIEDSILLQSNLTSPSRSSPAFVKRNAPSLWRVWRNSKRRRIDCDHGRQGNPKVAMHIPPHIKLSGDADRDFYACWHRLRSPLLQRSQTSALPARRRPRELSQ